MRPFLTILLVLAAFRPDRAAAAWALVVIDMQPTFAERRGWHHDARNAVKIEAVLRRQRELIAAAKRRDVPIILVEYMMVGPMHQVLVDDVGAYWKSLVVPKNKDGLFDEATFSAAFFTKYLREWKIDGLVICGANAGACVHETIGGALSHGLSVWAELAGIIDFRFAEFKHTAAYEPGAFAAHGDRFAQGDALELLGLASAPDGPDGMTTSCASALAVSGTR